MCLHVQKKLTTEFRKKYRKQKTFIAYKVVQIIKFIPVSIPPDLYSPPVLKSEYQSYIYTVGKHISNNAIFNRIERPFKKLCNDYGIYDGFHVYLSRNKAKSLCNTISGNKIVMPVLCRVSDLIAIGCKGDAVLTQIELTQKTYDRIIKVGK